MKRIILLSMLLLSACGGPNIDPALQPYVDSFKEHAERYNTRLNDFNYDILLDDMIGDTPLRLGYCGPSGIRIRRSYWTRANDWEKEVLMFHELGHCAIGLDHSSNPQNIMYPYILWWNYYMNNKEALLRELFTSQP